MWSKLVAGLGGLLVPAPSEKALRDLRRRLGPVPFKALFEIVAGPLARPGVPELRHREFRTVAFGGLNSLRVPDTDRNRRWLANLARRLLCHLRPDMLVLLDLAFDANGFLAGIDATGAKLLAPGRRGLPADHDAA